MMPLEEQHTRYHQLLERALAEDLTDINRFKVGFHCTNQSS
jgi:hypothetical protein